MAKGWELALIKTCEDSDYKETFRGANILINLMHFLSCSSLYVISSLWITLRRPLHYCPWCQYQHTCQINWPFYFDIPLKNTFFCNQLSCFTNFFITRYFLHYLHILCFPKYPQHLSKYDLSLAEFKTDWNINTIDTKGMGAKNPKTSNL